MGSIDGHFHRDGIEGADELLKRELDTDTLTSFGHQQSGCINDGQGYKTDHGTVFVKFNSNTAGEEMFQGEYEGLIALRDTGVITVPKPCKMIKGPCGSAMLVLEYMNLNPLEDFAGLGEQVARLHLHNARQRRKACKFEHTITSKHEDLDFIDKFGFHVPTYAGYSRQSNTWSDNWVDFFARKMDDYVSLIEEKHNDRDARPLWHTLVPIVHKLFRDVTVEPALLHGDLWRGNIAQCSTGPISFDPIPLYGHSEFELSIMHKHGGYKPDFFESYHAHMPKASGYDDRYDFYCLHHHFQIWSHFGDDFVEGALGIVEPEVFRPAFGAGFKESTLRLLEKLIRKCSNTSE